MAKIKTRSKAAQETSSRNVTVVEFDRKMEIVAEQIASSRDSALQFLVRAGIATPKGNLKKAYK